MRDLISGDRNGNLTLFLETGSGLHKVGYITWDSSGTQVPIKGNLNSFPFIVDWNEDGKKDIVFGEQVPTPPNTGNIRIYLNIGTNNAPSFSTYSLVYAGANPINIYCACPIAYDLDVDGKKDLIVGANDGSFLFYKNIGANNAPQFASTSETLKLNTSVPISVGTYAHPALADFKGDGDLDLVVGGNWTYLYYFENTRAVSAAEAGPRGPTSQFYISPTMVFDQVDISYTLAQSGLISLDVYTIDGRHAAGLIRGVQEQGIHALTWNADEQPAGVYLMKLSSPGQTQVKHIVIVR